MFICVGSNRLKQSGTGFRQDPCFSLPALFLKFGIKGTKGFDDYECNYYYLFDTSAYPASATERIAEAYVNWEKDTIEYRVF